MFYISSYVFAQDAVVMALNVTPLVSLALIYCYDIHFSERSDGHRDTLDGCEILHHLQKDGQHPSIHHWLVVYLPL